MYGEVEYASGMYGGPVADDAAIGTFPDIAVEVAFTTDPGSETPAWFDISDDYMAIDITRGRSRELDTFQAGTANIRLLDLARLYDPSNQYVDLPGIAGAYVSAPDTAALSILGDIDLRAEVSLDDWTPAAQQTVLAKYNPGANQRSYQLGVRTTGVLRINWSANGTTGLSLDSSVATGFVNGTRHWIRVTLDVDNGAAGRDAKFYTSDDGVTWIQLGTTQSSATATSIFDSTAYVALGANSADAEHVNGSLYRAEIRNGIGGTIVARSDFTMTPWKSGVTSGADAYGNTWTINGTAAVAPAPYAGNMRPMERIRIRATWEGVTYSLFAGYIDSIEHEYDAPREALAIATITATDGFKPLEAAQLATSAYYQEILADNPVAWWRLGEGAGATVAFDAVGTRDLTAKAFAPDVIPTFGVTGLISRESDTAMEIVAPNEEGGVQRSIDQIITGNPLTVELVWKGTNTELLVGQSSLDQSRGYSLLINTGTGTVRFFAGNTFVPVSSTNAVNDGVAHHIAGVWETNGTQKIYIDGIDRSDSVVQNAPGAFSGVDFFVIGGGPFGQSSVDGAIGIYDEVAVYNTALSATRVAAHAAAVTTPWNNDTPRARLNRILDVARWPQNLRELDVGTSVLQSATLDGSVLEHAQKVADSDFGAIFVAADGRVRFIGRAGLFNLVNYATFGDTTGELRYRELVPEYTDQLIRNDVTVSRSEGVAQTVTDESSITAYLPHSYISDGLFHDSDSVSRAAAEFIVSEYKDPLRRISGLTITAHGDPTTLFPQVLGRELQDQVTVIDRPPGGGILNIQDSAIEGIQHSISPKIWTTRWNLAPAFGTAGDPDVIGVWDAANWDESRWGF